MRRFLLLFVTVGLGGIAWAVLSAAEPAPTSDAPAKAPSAKRVAAKTAPSGVGPSAAKENPVRDTPAEQPARGGKGPTIDRCSIKLIQEVEVPGIESGVLMALEAKEGMEVRSGTILGHIDDRQPVLERRVNQLKHDAARAQADSDVDVKYSRKAADVALFTYKKHKAAADLVHKAVVETELRKLQLEAEKAALAIEKAEIERQQKSYEADTKGVEVEASELSIERRKVRAPFDGTVTEVYCHPGEWVAPGDRVIKVVQLDRMRVEGFLKASEYDPHEIDGRPVTIETELARGRKVSFEGKISFVSPRVSPGGEYVVFAEVKNRQEDGHWVLRDGLEATMTIHLK